MQPTNPEDSESKDLTTAALEAATLEVGQIIPKGTPTLTAPATLADKQEQTRARIATGLVGGFGFLIMLLWATVQIDRGTWTVPEKMADRMSQMEFKEWLAYKEKRDQAGDEMMRLILTSSVGLLGGAIGYYFGSREPKA